MRVGVVGSRGFNDYPLLLSILDKVPSVDCIVSGGANGADSLAARFAKERNIKLIEFIPDWNLYGKRAGFIRNELIIDNSDIVYAFWDGVSKGTQHSIKLAKNKGLNCLVIRYNTTEEKDQAIC